jgi:hypothetical protein
MGLLLTTIAAGSVWIVLIALGIKPFDGLLVALAMVLVAATAHVFAPFLPGNRREEQPGERYIRR